MTQDLDTMGIEPMTFHMRSENHSPRPSTHFAPVKLEV